jgi:hypothetical protein
VLFVWSNVRNECSFAFFNKISIRKHYLKKFFFDIIPISLLSLFALFFTFFLLLGRLWLYEKTFKISCQVYFNSLVLKIFDKSILMFLEQQNGHSRSIHSCSSSYPVNVVIWVFRRINLYYIIDSLKINPSRNHIGCK